MFQISIEIFKGNLIVRPYQCCIQITIIVEGEQEQRFSYYYKQLIIQRNMHNFWNTNMYFGHNIATYGNNSIYPFWYNPNLFVPQINQSLTQCFNANDIPKAERTLEQQPKTSSYQSNVKMQQVMVEKEVKNAVDEQGLTKTDLISLKGSYRKLKWSQQDDNIIIDLYDNQGKDMHEVSKKIEGVSEKMCMTRYKRLKKTQLKYWTREEDNLIKNMVAQIGQQWKEISQRLPNRTAKQIRQHYLNSLRPQIKKTPWTPQQDLLIHKLVKQKGKQWCLFEKFLIGRTENNIKNRYYGRIKKIEDIKKSIQNNSKINFRISQE